MIWLLGQAVKTPPFHGGNTGSSPVGFNGNMLTFLMVKYILKKSFTVLMIWLLGQAVKTPPFHGGNTGSSPVGVITIF